jgi:hypothetical protein
MRASAATGTIAALGLAVVVLQPSASAEPGASGILDRTFSCTTSVQAGVRKIDVHAQAGVRDGTRAWKWLPTIYVGTPGVAGPGPNTWAMVGIRAGWPAPQVAPDRLTPAGVWVGAGRCRPYAAAPAPALSRRGLSGGAASPFQDDYTCRPTRTVLVRVHATFRARTSFRLHADSGQLRAAGELRRAELVVRTPSGEPLVYGEVRESGSARLFTTGRCIAR